MNARILMFAALLIFGSVSAYTTTIHAPAVLSNENSGVITIISLNLTRGNGDVTVNGPTTVGLDTIASAQTAAGYASSYLGLNESLYNFNYTIEDSSTNVSGPSAGLAFTLLAVDALSHKQIPANFTVTGTISPNGNVGEVGGVYDKMGAASENGLKYGLIPQASTSDPEYLTYYLAQQRYKIPLVQVQNVSQALKYITPSGGSLVRPMAFNITKNYHVNGLPDANITCTGCNMSYFGLLVNYTYNYSQVWASVIGANLSSAKQNILQNINTYKEIGSKGYLYESADLSFLQYPDIFTLANANNVTAFEASSIISNIKSYCNSLTPPQMTNLNYEYIIGGELRQEWGLVNLQGAQTILNASQTTDDVIDSIYVAAPSYAWCSSSAEMYSIASLIGGNPVSSSSSLKVQALNQINSAEAYGSNLYIQSAQNAYTKGEYGTALYGAMYAQTFGTANPAGNLTIGQIINLTKATAENSTYGIWPSQFANSAMFGLYEAESYSGNQRANATSAYITSLLAANLAKANRLITSSFVPANITSISNTTLPSSVASLLQNQSGEIMGLSQQVSQLYDLVFVLLLIMAIVAILLFAHLLRARSDLAAPRARRRGRAR